MSKPFQHGSRSDNFSTNKRRASGQMQAAFTLVELLGVIGIIAILIALLLPALNTSRLQSKTINCASNQRQLYKTLTMCANDYNGHLTGHRTSFWPSATCRE